MSWDAASPFADLPEAQREQLAVALGVKEAPPDPAQLRRDADSAQQQATRAEQGSRQAQAELAAYRAAMAAGADPDRLLDSRAFLAKVGSLDPTAEGFAEALGEAIRSTAPSTAPAEQPQHQVADEQRQWTMDDVHRAQQENPALIFDAQQRGQLRGLGYPPTGDEVVPILDPDQISDPRVRKAVRRRQLTADYDGEITVQDVQDADPHVVTEWGHQGKLVHLGVPAQKRRG